VLQIEFTQLIVDECQQIGSTSSNLYSLLCAVRVQQRLLMSGEKRPAVQKQPASALRWLGLRINSPQLLVVCRHCQQCGSCRLLCAGAVA
jgi:hypothetical protein